MRTLAILILLTFQISLVKSQPSTFLTVVNDKSLRGGIACDDSTYIGIGIKASFAGYDTTYCLADCPPDEDTIVTERWEPDFFFAKVNHHGDTLWTKSFGGSGGDRIDDIIQFDENFVVTGYSTTNSKGHNDVFITKINLNADTLWTVLIGGEHCDWAFSSVVSSNDDILSIGSTASFGNGGHGDENIYLIKLSSNGDTIFTKTYGDSLYGETGLDIIQTYDENFVILADSYYDRNRKIILLKINSDGEILWDRRYAGNYSPTRILEDSENNLVITGIEYQFGENYDEDLFLFKTNSNGDSLWEHTYGVTREAGYYISESSDNNYIVCGSTGSINGGASDLGLFKISTTGSLLWQRSYNLCGGNDWGKYVKETYDGGYIVIGTEGGSGFILKTDQNGMYTSIQEFSPKINEFTIYPSPFSDILTVTNNNLSHYSILFYSLNGSLLATLDLNLGENNYNLSFLHSGVYIYSIVDNTGLIIQRGKIIKTFANTRS